MSTLARDPRAVALLLAAMLTIMSNATISPALPGIEAMFSDNPNAGLLTRMLVTAPALLVAVTAPFAGMAADAWGRRRQLIVGVLVFAAAGAAPLVLPSLPMILVSRLFLGLGVAAIMTSQAALVGDYYEGATRAKFMGYQIAAANFGGFFFISLAGVLAGLSARLPFAIYGLAFLFVPVLWRHIVEPDRYSGEETPQVGDDAAGAWPLIVGVASGLAGLTFVVFYQISTQMPFYLGTIGHEDPAAAGQILAAMTLAGGCASLVFGRVHLALGRGLATGLGYVFMAAGFWLLLRSSGMVGLSAAGASVGAGLGLVMPAFIAMALGAAPAHRRGVATGAVTTSIFLGQFLSPVVSQPLIERIGFTGTFWTSVVAMLAVAVFTTLYFGPRLPQRQPA